MPFSALEKRQKALCASKATVGKTCDLRSTNQLSYFGMVQAPIPTTDDSKVLELCFTPNHAFGFCFFLCLSALGKRQKAVYASKANRRQDV